MGHLEEDELGAESGLVEVHEGGQLGQRDGGVQLEQLLEAGQVALLLHQPQEAPQLQPVCLLHIPRRNTTSDLLCELWRSERQW